MDDSNKKPPPYAAYYGMAREPFGSTIEDELFYAEPTRKQRLDILLHLAQYGNELMLVTGPEGSGKTTLLQQFQNKALDSWSIAHIDAKEGMDERKLVQQLYHQMGMKFHGATHAELLENMGRHFNSLQHSARQAVLLIDNANQLPITAINQVLEMAALTNAENKPLLCVILFGTPELEAHFSNPQIHLPMNLVQRTLDLPPFDEEHTAHYILHRLSVVGFVDNEPFTENVLRRLHKQSGGWPGHINDFAHNLLADSLPSKVSEEIGGTVKPLRVIAAIAVTIVMGSILIWQDDINSWLKPAEKPLNAKNSNQVIEPAPPFISKSEPMPPEHLAGQKVTAETIPELVPEDATASKITGADLGPTLKPADVAADQALSLDEALDSISLIKGDLDKGTPAEKAKPAGQKPLAQAGMTNNLSQLPAHQRNWLLEQNPSHYTLQLVAGEQIATIEKFIHEQQIHDNLAFYRTIRNGKPWFGLLYGIYTSKQEAIDARSRLPKKLRTLAPWVREITEVQKDIRKILL